MTRLWPFLAAWDPAAPRPAARDPAASPPAALLAAALLVAGLLAGVVGAGAQAPSAGAGREVYGAQACWQCHALAVDDGFPRVAETARTGPVIGAAWLPRSREWHLAHFYAPRELSPESQMPSYAALFDRHPHEAAVRALVERYDSADGSANQDGVVTRDEYERAGGGAWEAELSRLDTGNGVVSLADAAPRPKRELLALLAYLDRQDRAVAPAVRPPGRKPGDAAASLRRGRALFSRTCAGCHGARGDGNGPAARFFPGHPPRNFRRGEFKFRTTMDPAPLDADLFRTIRRGAGPSMPAWPLLSNRQVWDLVEFVKSLHYGYLVQELFVREQGGDVVLAFVQGEEAEVDDAAGAPLGDGFVYKGEGGAWWWIRGGERRPVTEGMEVTTQGRTYRFRLGRTVFDWMEDFRPRPLAIPAAPFPYTAASAEIGRKVYAEFGCADCHGAEGRGDGPAAAKTRGNLGEVVLPADYTRGARWLKGGSDARSLVRGFLTGLHGTPMPAYAANFQAAVSAPPAGAPWHLAHFVMRQAGLPPD